ncbi:unnamed protein product [Larinioides sclopetarius]|uniref:Uncharacterized protein n=1 Tax=Larinioides sclopetarius TaxID=280406 RepID=A0AAV1ZW15_9ARAC
MTTGTPNYPSLNCYYIKIAAAKMTEQLLENFKRVRECSFKNIYWHENKDKKNGGFLLNLSSSAFILEEQSQPVALELTVVTDPA